MQLEARTLIGKLSRKKITFRTIHKQLKEDSKEIKSLYIAIGSKDADIAALKEKISSLLQDTDFLMQAVSKVGRD